MHNKEYVNKSTTHPKTQQTMPKVRITLDKPSHNMQQFQLQQIFVIRSLISLLQKY